MKVTYNICNCNPLFTITPNGYFYNNIILRTEYLFPRFFYISLYSLLLYDFSFYFPLIFLSSLQLQTAFQRFLFFYKYFNSPSCSQYYYLLSICIQFISSRFLCLRQFLFNIYHGSFILSIFRITSTDRRSDHNFIGDHLLFRLLIFFCILYSYNYLSSLQLQTGYTFTYLLENISILFLSKFLISIFSFIKYINIL